MNLYLRLLWLLWHMRGMARRGVFDESRLSFRVLPNDLDLNLHMNNGRYLTFMDLGRVHLMVQGGLMAHVRRKRWMPVLAAADITYLRSLNPFERDGELCAHAYVKGLFLSGEGRVPNAEVVGIMGYAGAAPVMSEALRRWAALTMTKRDSVK